MKRVFITGAGNLGLAVHSHFSGTDDFDPVIVSRRGTSGPNDMIECDITRHDRMNDIVSEIEPAVVIHTAAMTNVDLCEREPGKAHEINAAGTENLAATCSREKIPLVYISTDYVFDGTKGDYCEDDRTAPVNVYGRTKLEGERSVMGIAHRWAVIRTSFLHNPESLNYDFISYVIKSVSRRERIECDDFRFTKPTPCSCIGPVIKNIVRCGKWGEIYHVCGKSKLTPYAIAKECANALHLDHSLIRARRELPEANAPRPVDPTLDTQKAERELGFVPPDPNFMQNYDGWTMNGEPGRGTEINMER